MQTGKVIQIRSLATKPAEVKREIHEFLDKKHVLYRRMERWLRLQQFVYGLPADDYAYAIHASDRAGLSTCRSLVRVGWFTWYGVGHAMDRHQALASALLETSEAVSANPYRVFLFSATRWAQRVWRRVSERRWVPMPSAVPAQAKNEVLAG